MAVFSIIVPVYNVEQYLSACVDSILNQTFSNFELLLVDDGSSDRSGALCDAYASADQRIRVIHKANGGLSSARNCGMKAVTGEYIVFLDSDDYWDNNQALALIHHEFLCTKADVVLLKHRKMDTETGTLQDISDTSSTSDIANLSYAQQLAFCVSRQLFDTCAWNKVFRRSLMDHQDLYFIQGIIAEDLDWAARLSLAASRLAIVAEPVHIYRKGRPGSITTSLKLKNLIDTQKSIERCLAYVSQTDYDQAFLDAYYSYVAYRYVIWMAESAVVSDPEKKPLIRAMAQYRWILNYGLNQKVKLANLLTHIIGFSFSSKILGLYLTAKR